VPAGRLIEDILALARVPAPTFAEEARIAWLERRLRDAPGRRTHDEAGNLLWTWGQGEPELVVAAHVDTVYPAGTPLEPRREGDALLGPGVGDNAAAVAVAVHVVEPLLRRVRMRAGAVAFTVGEEGLGDLRGARAVCRAWPRAALVALEGHGLERVLVDAVGSVRVRLRAAGPGGHSWNDRDRPSAIHALLDLGSELVRAGDSASPVNVGLIAGGRSVNTIADSAEMTLEMRSLDEAALERFATGLEQRSLAPPLTLDAEPVGRRPAGRLDRGHPLLAAVRAVRAEIGLPDALGEGSTDANAALAAGMPALCLGVTSGRGMHTLEERIEVPPLVAGCRQLEGLLLWWLSA
jgi:acetylornithine deacetylase/succinyl-diaminopimelate desuccinylase-like protein